MDFNNGFFVDTPDAAVEEMKNICGCEIRPCPIPTLGRLEYYVSEHGDLFPLIKVGTQFFCKNEPNKPFKLGKRRGVMLQHRVSVGRHKEIVYPTALLVYCAFVLGFWNPELKLMVKNGDVRDIRLDNIALAEPNYPPEWEERLEQYKDIYRKEYNRIVNIVQFKCGRSKEEAQDIVSYTFMKMLTDGFSGKFDVGLWCFSAKRYAIDFYHRYIKHFSDEEFDETLYDGCNPPSYELDLIHIQGGEQGQRCLALWSQGIKPKDIAEMTGIERKTVSSHVTRRIQFLRRYLENDIKQQWK